MPEIDTANRFTVGGTAEYGMPLLWCARCGSRAVSTGRSVGGNTIFRCSSPLCFGGMYPVRERPRTPKVVDHVLRDIANGFLDGAPPPEANSAAWRDYVLAQLREVYRFGAEGIFPPYTDGGAPVLRLEG